MIEDVACHDGTDACPARLSRQRIDADRVPRPTPLEQGHIAATPVDSLQVLQRGDVLLVRLVRQQDGDNTLGPRLEVVPVEEAPALARPLLADGEQPRDPRPGGPVGRIEQQAPAAGQIDARARDRADACGFLRLPCPYDTPNGADVADADRRVAEQRRGREQLLRRRRAAQERKMGEHL